MLQKSVTLAYHALNNMVDIFCRLDFEGLFLKKFFFAIAIKIHPFFIPDGLINSKSALVQVMTWYRTGDMPLPRSVITHFVDACISVVKPVYNDHLRQNLLTRPNWYLQSLLKHIINKSQVLNFIVEVVVADRFHCSEKLNFWGTLTQVNFLYSPKSKCTRISERASFSFPHGCRHHQIHHLMWTHCFSIIMVTLS